MKKILVLTLLFLISTVSFVCARTQYDSTGRHIIYDDSLRGQKRASQQQIQERRIQAAAAAKINYEELAKELERPQTKSSSNQDLQEYKNNQNIK